MAASQTVCHPPLSKHNETNKRCADARETDHMLEEEGTFLSDAAKARLPELARQYHLLYNRLSREALAEVPVVKGVEDVPEDALFHPFGGVAGD